MHTPSTRTARWRRVGAALLTLGVIGGGLAIASPAQAAAADEFVAVKPVRVYETRPTAPPEGLIPDDAVKPTNNSITQVTVTGDITGTSNVPDDVAAIALTVTGVQSTADDNYLTVWDCVDNDENDAGIEPDPPSASNLNLELNDIRPNSVISRVTPDGEVCVYARNAVHLIVDVTGYWPDTDGSSAEITLADAPDRILDTRPGAPAGDTGGWQGGKPEPGQVLRVDLPEGFNGPNPQILNVTGVQGEAGGWITVWDCADAAQEAPLPHTEPDPPRVSALNLEPGIIAANLVVTESKVVEGADEICIFTSKSAHIIVDHIGAFPEATSSLRTSSDTFPMPKRILETRAHQGAVPTGATKMVDNQTTRLSLRGGPDNVAHIPDGAEGVILNVTGTESSTGFVTVYPCNETSDPRPTASNLNLVAGQTRPNLVITAVSDLERICIYTQKATHMVVDLVGYFQTRAA